MALWLGLGVSSLAGATSNATPLTSDPLESARRALQDGQAEQAQQLLTRLRKQTPDDARVLFLQGVLLAQQGKTDLAIDTFRQLTRSHPQLSEPHNNLGVLLASKGQLTQARAAFEQALLTHPSLAAAHRNLLDVQTQLAQQSYARALMLEGTRVAAPQLTLLAGIPAAAASGGSQGAFTGPASASNPPASTSAGSAAPAVALPSMAQASTAVKVASTAAAATASPAKAAAQPMPAKPAPAPAQTQSADSATAQEARVREQLEAWAKAWSQQDMKAYLAAYARDFQTPGGMSRSQWEADRQLKITSKKRIRVEVSQLQIRWREQEATVQFRQAYESDNLKVVSRKTLIWVLRDGQWRILRETTG